MTLITNLFLSGDGGSAETIIIVIAVGVGMILALTGFSIWKRKRLLSACNGKTQQKGKVKSIQELNKARNLH